MPYGLISGILGIGSGIGPQEPQEPQGEAPGAFNANPCDQGQSLAGRMEAVVDALEQGMMSPEQGQQLLNIHYQQQNQNQYQGAFEQQAQGAFHQACENISNQMAQQMYNDAALYGQGQMQVQSDTYIQTPINNDIGSIVEYQGERPQYLNVSSSLAILREMYGEGMRGLVYEQNPFLQIANENIEEGTLYGLNAWLPNYGKQKFHLSHFDKFEQDVQNWTLTSKDLQDEMAHILRHKDKIVESVGEPRYMAAFTKAIDFISRTLPVETHQSQP